MIFLKSVQIIGSYISDISTIPGSDKKLKQNAMCNTEVVVYLISCIICHKRYVCETRKAVSKSKIKLHRSDWKTKNLCSHSVQFSKSSF